MSCSVDGCSLPALVLCKCVEGNLEFCEVHSDFHQNQFSGHKLELIHVPISGEIKKDIISVILNEYRALDQLKSRLEQISRILINTINLSLSHSLKPIIKSQSALLHKISKISHNNFIKSSELDELLDTKELTFKIKPEIFDYFNLIHDIDSFYSRDFQNNIQKFNENSEGLSNTFTLFTNNSTTLSILDPYTEELGVFELKLEKTMGGNAGSCLLPDKKVFYYGGQINVMTFPLDICCIIDPEMKKVEYKKKGPKKLYNIGTCAYLNSKIYLFGGCGKCSSVCNEAFEYNMDNDSWKSLSNLPKHSEKNCALAVCGGIAVTGFRIGAYIYDVEQDAYNEKAQKSEGNKILLDCGKFLIILMNGQVYKWNDSSIEVVEGKQGVSSELHLKSFPVILTNWTYFLLSDKTLYRVHHRTLLIEKLKKYENLFG